jgi:hypothetical protein
VCTLSLEWVGSIEVVWFVFLWDLSMVGADIWPHGEAATLHYYR